MPAVRLDSEATEKFEPRAPIKDQKRIPKRIILLCDGTGNSASRSNELATNVKRMSDALAQRYTLSSCENDEHPKNPRTRLCTVCEDDKLVEKGEQVIFYQSGVGTSKEMGDVASTYAKGTGAGINDNILDAYHFLATNYVKGDELYIFGFSRGAFTARVVANLVIRLGLFHTNKLWMMRKAWAQYCKDDGGTSFRFFEKNLWEIDSKDTQLVTIRVLGVWDTVGAVGVPDYLSFMNSDDFHSPELKLGIEHCFHALALDEYRRTFGPTLFYLPSLAEKDKRKYRDRKTGEIKTYNDKIPVLKQCWFAGAHSNVGGSYPSQHIADISLAWMIDQIMLHGNLLEFNPYTIQSIVARHLNPALNLNALYRSDDGVYPGWGAGTIYDSFKGSASYVTWQYRAPGNYLPGQHPGPASVGPLPDITGMSLPDLSTPLSYLNPWSYKIFKKEPTEYEKIVDSLKPEPVGPPSYQLPTEAKGKYCDLAECAHPSRLGYYKRDEAGNPILTSHAEFSTCESIHGSVFARYKAYLEAQKPESKFKEQETARNNARSKLYPYVKGEEKRKVVSLLSWDPQSLACFKETDPEKAKTNRYRRKELPSGIVVWTGTCVRSKKLFEIVEEPDSLRLPLEKLSTLPPSLRQALEVGQITRTMNTKAEYGVLDNPWPLSAPAAPGEPPVKKVKRTQEQEEKDWENHLYLQDDFDLKEITKLRAERMKNYREEWRKNDKAKRAGHISHGVVGIAQVK